MAQEFWSDKPLTITISGKSPNNSGIPKIDITGEKGIICGPNITSTTTSLNSSVSNNRAGSSANSVSAKFYASCEWDNPRTLTTNVNTYGNIPGCGKSTGNIKVKVWWDSVKKGDSSDDTYVEQTISNVTIKNAVETIDITGLSYSNGNPIPFKNGAYALDGYHEYEGVYLNYTLRGEYHKPKFPNSLDITYMPIYDSTVSVNINNAYFDSYTCVPIGTTYQYTINGKYFIPAKFTESTSTASTAGSTSGDIVRPGDTVATPFPVGSFQIVLQALGGHRQPSTAVTLDVAGLEPELVIESFTFSDSTQNISGMPTIVFGNGVDPAYVNVSYSSDTSIAVDSDTGQIESDTLTELFVDSVDRYKIGEVTATCTFGTQTVEQTVDVYMAASIVSYIKLTPINNGTDYVRISLLTLDTSVPTIYYSTTGKNFQQMSISYNNSQWYEFSKETPIYIYGVNPRGFSRNNTDAKYSYFEFNGVSNFDISGNIMGLIDGFKEVTTIPSLYCFYKLFFGISLIHDASALRLPAKVIKGAAYYGMFMNCNNMVAGPDIDGTDNSGYGGTTAMFYGCTSLVECPKFNFEKVGPNACREMFMNCYKLINPPKILPATTLANSCYLSMFYSCHKIKFAPELPAKTLVNDCYKFMFADCKELRYVKALFTTNITNNTNYTKNWMYGVNTSTGVFVKAVDATWKLPGASGIPTNWDYAYNYSNNEMEIVNTIYDTGQYSCGSLVADTESASEPNIILLYNNIHGTLPKNSFTNAIETIVISPYIQSISTQAFVPKALLGDKAMHLTLVDMRDAGKNTRDGESYLSILGDRAFAGNNVLKRVFLPYSINTKGNDIFYGCSQLTEIWYDGTTEEYNENIGTISFGAFMNPNCKIICTDGDITIS